MGETSDRALIAFRRLLREGNAGGQRKVDAIVALAQRTIFVPTWTEDGGDFRPLISSDGTNALPLFSSKSELEEAARRYGWIGSNGEVPHKEIGSRTAFRHAVAHQLHFVVIDIASDHGLEVERSEIEPLLQSQNRSDSSGAFAGVGRISEQMLRQIRRSSVPASAPEFQQITVPTDVLTPSRVPSDISPEALPNPIALAASPSELLLDEISALLRNYPEVEWAAYFTSEGDRNFIGLRVDGGFRTRVEEIIGHLLEVGNQQRLPLRVVILDDASLSRRVREFGVAFYPWRRRT